MRTVICVYECICKQCRNVEEFREDAPRVRHCTRCGRLMKLVGKRQIER